MAKDTVPLGWAGLGPTGPSLFFPGWARTGPTPWAGPEPARPKQVAN